MGLERDPASVLVGYMLFSAVLWVSGSWAPQQVGRRGVVEREGSTASMESTGEEKRQCFGRFQKDGILEVLTWPGFLLAPSDTSGSSPRPWGEAMGDVVWPRPFLGFHHLPCSRLLSAEAVLISPTAPPGPLGSRTRGLNVRRVGPTPLALTCPSLISLAPHGHTATIRKLC